MRRIAIIPAGNRYADDAIPSLVGAEADAIRFGELLSTHAGFEIVPFVGPETCSKLRFKQAVEELVRTLSAGDLLLIFAPMHATVWQGEQFLVFPEARLVDVQHGETSHAVPLSWIEAITARPGLNRALVLDTCRNHLQVARLAGPPVATVESSARNLVAAGAGAGNDDERALTILSACRKGCSAQEIPKLGRGLFSLAFEEVFLQRIAAGLEVALDDGFALAVARVMRRLAHEHGLQGRQEPDRSHVGPVTVLVPGAGSASPISVGSSIQIKPEPVMGTGVLERIRREREQREREAKAREERRLAEIAAARKAFDHLYPEYLAAQNDPAISNEDLALAWKELCEACRVTDRAPFPGILEWAEDRVRWVNPLDPARIARERPLVNHLGMQFVPVHGTPALFSIWLTRVRDFEAFVNATGRDMGTDMWCFDPKDKSTGRAQWKRMPHTWRTPGFSQTGDHPVVGANFSDASDFCAWLTDVERGRGRIGPRARYRLPTDEEWSLAVGSAKYPWGDAWPPPAGAGNYAGEEFDEGWDRIKGYRDDYLRTSPVGRFLPNAFGLFDLGGNTWEWCDTWYRKELNSEEARKQLTTLENDGGGQQYRVLRGASWLYGHPVLLESRFRDYGSPRGRVDYVGFRCVLEEGEFR